MDMDVIPMSKGSNTTLFFRVNSQQKEVIDRFVEKYRASSRSHALRLLLEDAEHLLLPAKETEETEENGHTS